MNDDNDLYYTDERQSERLIAESEMNMSNETVANRAYNEGFFNTCTIVNQQKYDEGFQSGKAYSIEYGKLVGVIDAFLFYTLEINHNEDSTFKTVDPIDLNKLKEVRSYLEEYKEEISNEFIEEKQNALNSIISKYL